MRKIVAIGVLAAAVALAACDAGRAENSGPRVSKNFAVAGFDAIDVEGPYDVQVRTGVNPSVSATGPQKMIDRLTVEVQGNRLVVRPQQESGFRIRWGSDDGVRVEVTVPQLQAAKLAGSGDLRVNQVKGGSFEGSLAGSGDLSIDALDVNDLKLEIAGSGDVKAATGRAKNLNVNVAGSGNVDAKSVQAETAAISIAGSGDVTVHVTGQANVSVMGSGDVSVTGGAKCTISKQGSGDVRCG